MMLFLTAIKPYIKELLHIFRLLSLIGSLAGAQMPHAQRKVKCSGIEKRLSEKKKKSLPDLPLKCTSFPKGCLNDIR